MSDGGTARIVVFGGKGGVGKTTCASATGVALADRGARTLLVSTDPAHSLSDVFGDEVTDDPVRLRESLYGIEIDPTSRFSRRYSEKLQDLLDRASTLGLDVDSGDISDIAAHGVVPGSDELAVIDLFGEYVGAEDWDAVVFDTAPTGHTLRMLQLPDVAGEALSKAATVTAGIDGVAAAATRLLGRSSTDDGLHVSRDIERAQRQMELVSEAIEDDRTTFNIVTTPEEMALAETRRLHEQLQDEGVPIGTIVANKVRLDVDESCAFCTTQRAEQTALLREAESALEASIYRVPALPGMSDRDRVEQIAESIPLPGRGDGI